MHIFKRCFSSVASHVSAQPRLQFHRQPIGDLTLSMMSTNTRNTGSKGKTTREAKSTDLESDIFPAEILPETPTGSATYPEQVKFP